MQLEEANRIVEVKNVKIVFKSHGDFSRLRRYLSKVKDPVTLKHLQKYGEEGVRLLKEATPVDSGTTAASWSYEIENDGSRYSIVFYNSNVVDGWFNVALMLDVGHGTGKGGWVEGLNYIDPAIQPVFEKMARDLWMEVTNL